ncbi:hypothetical protein [Actinoallomurus sp. NPDC050550]|uniref:hypothetical protein n=1 Tax=Actinoallomurus sp. NPDC050550 TaxID=3154937 RepID=UPI0033CB3F78
MAWFTAEQTAHELIAGRLPTAMFEYRATRDVLALTIYLSPRPADPDLIRDRLDDGWPAWCQTRLAEHPDCLDLTFARAARRWLCTRLLGSSGPLTDSRPAHQIGLIYARRTLAPPRPDWPSR